MILVIFKGRKFDEKNFFYDKIKKGGGVEILKLKGWNLFAIWRLLFEISEISFLISFICQ